MIDSDTARAAARSAWMKDWGRFVVLLLALGGFCGFGARAAAQESAPEGVEYRLYVANESSDIVSRVVFRPGAGAEVEKEIPVGIMPADNDGAHGLTVSPDGAFWYLTIAHGTPYGYVWKFAAGADTLVARAELGLFPATMGVTPNGQFLVVANFNLHGDMVPSDLSVVYTPTMTQLSRVTTCLMPHGSRVSASGGLQYSACMHSDQLVEFDLTALEVSRRFSLAPGREGPLDARDQGMGGHVMVMSGAEAGDPAGAAGAGAGGAGSAGAAASGTGPGQAFSMRDDTSMGRMAGMADAVCSPTWAEPGRARSPTGWSTWPATATTRFSRSMRGTGPCGGGSPRGRPRTTWTSPPTACCWWRP